MNEKIAGYQLEIDRLKDELAKVERRSQGTGTQMLIALVGAILGAVLAFLGGDLICAVVGGVLMLAGVLALVTQYLKRSNAGEEARQIEAKIENYRNMMGRELNKPS